MASLNIGDRGQTYPLDTSKNMAIAQIGWIGHTGTVYPISPGPTRHQEPGGFAPLLIQVGTWVDLGDDIWSISD